MALPPTVASIRGHSDSILCCNWDGFTSLRTGSEDGSVGVFDIRTSAQSLRLRCFEGAEVPSICAHPAKQEVLFAAAGPVAYSLDLRKASGTDNNAAAIVNTFRYNQDEINQVATDPRGSLLAAADDSGEVKIINLSTSRIMKTLRGQHNNICTGVAFHPRDPTTAFSCGLDARAVRWDFQGARVQRTWDMNQLSPSSAATGGDASAPMFNPPFAHALAVAAVAPADATGKGSRHRGGSSRGRPTQGAGPRGSVLLAVARGDGLVALCDADAADATLLDAQGKGRGKPAVKPCTQKGSKSKPQKGGVHSAGPSSAAAGGAASGAGGGAPAAAASTPLEEGSRTATPDGSQIDTLKGGDASGRDASAGDGRGDVAATSGGAGKEATGSARGGHKEALVSRAVAPASTSGAARCDTILLGGEGAHASAVSHITFAEFLRDGTDASSNSTGATGGGGDAPPSCRLLLSGGTDTRICVWGVPTGTLGRGFDGELDNQEEDGDDDDDGGDSRVEKGGCPGGVDGEAGAESRYGGDASRCSLVRVWKHRHKVTFFLLEYFILNPCLNH
eukprot:jgi/Mesvir1/27620/Mv07352-RA.2